MSPANRFRAPLTLLAMLWLPTVVWANSPPAADTPEVGTVPTVVQTDAAELRAAGNGQATLRTLAQGNKAFVARLELAPGALVPEHRDESEEYIVVLSGGGTLTFEGKPYVIEAGSAVFMPAGAQVSFVNGAEPLVALQVFAGPASAAKYETWAV